MLTIPELKEISSGFPNGLSFKTSILFLATSPLTKYELNHECPSEMLHVANFSDKQLKTYWNLL